MNVLVVNAGSSSTKLGVVDGDDRSIAGIELGAIDQLETNEVEDALLRLTATAPVDAVGHRVVHGGTRFTAPVLLDASVRAELERLVDLAPLHQPKSLRAMDLVSAVLPDVAAVACFDTAFHATLPIEASTYPVPAEWRERYGVRRYGFHGLSHAYCARRVHEMLSTGDRDLRVVTAHLGAGASLAAVVGGRSVDTTMGFTPLDGLVMATRPGALDPGLVLWLEEHENIRPRDVAEALEHRSGLLALAGTSDMREIERRKEAGDPAASLAFAVFIHRLAAATAAMVVAAQGLDALAFTGGIGENSATVRRALVERLAFAGLTLDADADVAGTSDRVGGAADRDITATGSRARIIVVTAREDIEIARGVRAVLSGQLTADARTNPSSPARRLSP